MLPKLLLIFLCTTLSSAGIATANQVQEVPDLPSMHEYSKCFAVSSKQGWQTMYLPTVMSDGQILTVVDPDTIKPQDRDTYPMTRNIGWSVDLANFGRVGAQGHSGAAALALAPFEQYKYYKPAAFGALLARMPDGRVGTFTDTSRPFALPDVGYMDFRINDSDLSFGDNGGFLILCILDISHYK